MGDSNNKSSRIAIIGLSCRFPSAKTVDEYWAILRDGKEVVSFLSEEELIRGGASEAELKHPDYVRATSILEDVDRFDASFFGMGATHASLTDPQQRMFLECAWEALESAGYDPQTYEGAIGCFGGSSRSFYLPTSIFESSHAEEWSPLERWAAITSDKDYLTTLASYKLGLRGPSVNVQTACSTSLVAVHLACQSLLAGECDIALAGGITISPSMGRGYLARKGDIFSRDGHTRSFDAGGTGPMFGSGAGIVVLKRLEDAVADRDRIRAVVLGSAVNNDGSLKVGFTAPSALSQAEVIAEALGVADVAPETVSYVECHGSATPLGDSIEVAALTQVFAEGSSKRAIARSAP